MLKFIFTIILFPFIYSQNTCDNCINNINLGENVDCTNICHNQIVNLNNCKDYTRCIYDYNLHKIDDICVCQKTNCNYDYVCPYVEKINNNNLPGYTIFEVSLEVKNINYNIYAIYGTEENIMKIPAAYQKTEHQGVNVGGINPLLLNYIPDAQFDSWLTIGITDGNNLGKVDAIGIDFNNWDNLHPLFINNGAIFLDDPLQQISPKKYIIAHLTLKNNQNHQMIINVNGRIEANDINSDIYTVLNIIINFPFINFIAN